MGRSKSPLYKDPNSRYLFARWYEGKRRRMLTTATKDETLALQRYPIIVKTGMSWPEYQSTFSEYPENPVANIEGIHGAMFTPAVKINSTKQTSIQLIEEAILNNKAEYNAGTGNWIIKIRQKSGDVVESLGDLKNIFEIKNNWESIKDFWIESIPQLYISKKQALRSGRIWLQFLQVKGIKSWVEITELLVKDFQTWRESTSFQKRKGIPVYPSKIVIKRHLEFLYKSFEETVHRDLMRKNPIKNWNFAGLSYHAPLQEHLTVEELAEFFQHEKFDKNFMHDGSLKRRLGWSLRDLLTVIFVACKRKGEILKLRIEDVYWDLNCAYYIEKKNDSKGVSYCVHKSFYMTPLIKKILKRVAGRRITGYVFDHKGGFFSGDYLNNIVVEVMSEVAPGKMGLSTHNLRHTAVDYCESQGMVDGEIDDLLGHFNGGTALKFYKDRSKQAVAKRLASRTRRGVEMLTKLMESRILSD